MALRSQQVVRDEQPDYPVALALDHPLCPDFAIYTARGVQSKVFADRIYGVQPTASKDVSPLRSRSGAKCFSVGTSGAVDVPSNIFKRMRTDRGTFVWIGDHTGFTSGLWQIGKSFSSANDLAVIQANNTANCRVRFVVGSVQQFDLEGAQPARECLMAVTGGPAGARLFADGRVIASSASTSWLSAITDGNFDWFSVGYTNTGAASYSNVRGCPFLLWYPQQLTEGHLQELGQNPWCWLEPDSEPFFVTAASGTTLVIQDASHSHSADNLILTTDRLLAVQDSSHTHTAESPALVTDVLLAVADALHAHSADNLTIDASTGTTLVVADALHAHTADGLSLTIESTLSVQDAAHAHTADSPMISTEWLLTIADAQHAHSADQPTIDSGAALTIADAAHAHTAESPSLSTEVLIAIQDALHSHGADNVAISADGSITVTIDGAAHAHTADQIALTSQSLLVIADALHAHYADAVDLDAGLIPAWVLRIRVSVSSQTIPVVNTDDPIVVSVGNPAIPAVLQ